MAGVLQESVDEMVIEVRYDEDAALIAVLELEILSDSWSSAVFILDKRKEDVKQVAKRCYVNLVHFIIQELEPQFITQLILLGTQEVMLTVLIIQMHKLMYRGHIISGLFQTELILLHHLPGHN